jgi:hypothetical protein
MIQVHIRLVRVRSITTALLGSAALVVGVAAAGPNAGGTLIITENPTAYCLDDDTPEFCELVLLENCVDADTRADSYSFAAILDVVASFPQASSPRLAGITFGLDYDASTIVLLSVTSCGDFELPTADWPAPGSGTAVVWATARTEQLVRVYSLLGYSYYEQPALLHAIPHPTQGGFFADDDIPSNLDPIAAFGALGFFTDGNAPCLNGPITGACCLPDCTCQVMMVDECQALGGTYLGDDTGCDPAPCDWPFGACCLVDGTCVEMLSCACETSGGEFIGGTCEPNPCSTPALERTWGGVKATYR